MNITNYEHCSIKWLLYQKDNCLIDEFGRIYEFVEGKKYYASSSISDYMYDISEFIYITKIEVDDGFTGKCFGSKAVQAFLKQNEKYNVILEAGFLYEEDYEQACQNPELFDRHLDKLIRFYEKNGFRNANKEYGQYEDKVTMLYERK